MGWFSKREEQSDGELQTVHHNADRRGDTETKQEVEKELKERGWTGTKVHESQPTTWTFRRRR
jgi:hypothetical protein